MLDLFDSIYDEFSDPVQETVFLPPVDELLIEATIQSLQAMAAQFGPNVTYMDSQSDAGDVEHAFLFDHDTGSVYTTDGKLLGNLPAADVDAAIALL